MNSIMPAPKPDVLSAPFWEMANRQLLGVQRCLRCGAVHFPATPSCATCLGDELEWFAASGRATLYSWCRFHKAYWDSVVAALPYTVAMVRLAEGPVLITQLVDVPDLAALRLDQPVALCFVQDGDVCRPCFTPSAH